MLLLIPVDIVSKRSALRIISKAIPAQPVDKDSSSDDASSLTPVMNAVLRRLRSLLVRKSVVVHPRLLVCKVLQAVPLRTRLRVDVDLII